jgi:putative FmdB family regulatory protein
VPLYDYECRNCGHRVEVLHGVNDSGPTACAQCGGPMRKLLNTPAIVFKGSGWAKKDRSSSSGRSADKASTAGASNDSGSAESGSKSDGGSKSESTDSSSAKADTKAEGKSDTKPASTGTAGSAD